jgi:steroid delta-isomerase-like uncharacterized protein
MDRSLASIQRPLVELNADELVDRFLRAYNDKDISAIDDLLGEDVHMVHGERVDLRGRASVMRLLRDSADGAFPDRRFEGERRRLVDGGRVAVEHTWVATAARDVPGLATQGEAIRMELCTIFAVEDGRIVDYAEYG